MEDFLRGIDATFRPFVKSEQEHHNLIASARAFYSAYTGGRSKTGTSSIAEGDDLDSSVIPFWRYLIHYAVLALDRAALSSSSSGTTATRGSEDGIKQQHQHQQQQQPQQPEDQTQETGVDESIVTLARELASIWPFLAVVAGEQYHDTAQHLSATTQAAIQAEEQQTSYRPKPRSRVS